VEAAAPRGRTGSCWAGRRPSGGDLVVHGLAADAIESVEVIAGGATHEARMGENAFGLRLEHTHDAELERILLRRRNGTTNEIGLAPE
jgi:hypothetical protein